MCKDLELKIKILSKKVTDLEEMVQKFRYDPLTKLKGRIDFDEDMDIMWNNYEKNGTVFNLIIVDINNLHTVNRLDGYIAGDRYIRGVAEYLNIKKKSHAKLYRIGGDEFVILNDKLPEICSSIGNVCQQTQCPLYFECANIDDAFDIGSDAYTLAMLPSSAAKSQEELFNLVDAELIKQKLKRIPQER